MDECTAHTHSLTFPTYCSSREKRIMKGLSSPPLPLPLQDERLTFGRCSLVCSPTFFPLPPPPSFLFFFSSREHRGLNMQFFCLLSKFKNLSFMPCRGHLERSFSKHQKVNSKCSQSVFSVLALFLLLPSLLRMRVSQRKPNFLTLH